MKTSFDYPRTKKKYISVATGVAKSQSEAKRSLNETIKEVYFKHLAVVIKSKEAYRLTAEELNIKISRVQNALYQY